MGVVNYKKRRIVSALENDISIIILDGIVSVHSSTP